MMKNIKVRNILLWDQNPRGNESRKQNSTQKEIIDSFFSDNTKTTQMFNLAEDIAARDIIPTEIACLWKNKDNEFISIDGNRRITTLKLIDNPDLINHNIKAFSFYKKLSKQNITTEIACYITTDFEEAISIARRKHLGTDDGRGLLSWSPSEKAYFDDKVMKKEKSKINSSYLLVKKYPDKFEDLIKTIKSSSADRILDYVYVRNYFNLKNYTNVSEKKANEIAQYLQSALDYSEEKEVRISRFRVKDAELILNNDRPVLTKLPVKEEKESQKVIPELKIKKEFFIVNQGETFNLERIVLNKNDFTEIKYNQLDKIENYNYDSNIILSSNKPGNYKISIVGYSAGKEVNAKTITVSIREKQSKALTSSNNINNKLLVFGRDINIDINALVNSMVNEINRLDFKDFPNILTLSLRTILVESLNELAKISETKFNFKITTENLHAALDNFTKCITKKSNSHILLKIDLKLKRKKQQTKNFINQISVNRLNSTLNNLAHNATENTEEDRVKELSQKTISQLLVIISTLLNHNF